MTKYNTVERKEYSQIPQHYNGIYPYRSATERHEQDGWVDVTPFTAPTGYTIIQGTRTIDANGCEQYEVETDAESYARQWNENEKLWSAENAFIATMQAVNTAIGTDIGLTDGFAEIATKIAASEAARDDRQDSILLLRNAWDLVEVYGGSFGNVSYHEVAA